MLTTDQAPWLTWFDFTLCNITLLVFLLFWKPSFGTRSKCWKWADPWNRTLVLSQSDKKLPASGRLCLILKSNNYFLTFFQRYYNGFILHPYHRILPTCFILAHASFQISLFSWKIFGGKCPVGTFWWTIFDGKFFGRNFFGWKFGVLEYLISLNPLLARQLTEEGKIVILSWGRPCILWSGWPCFPVFLLRWQRSLTMGTFPPCSSPTRNGRGD